MKTLILTALSIALCSAASAGIKSLDCASPDGQLQHSFKASMPPGQIIENSYTYQGTRYAAEDVAAVFSGKKVLDTTIDTIPGAAAEAYYRQTSFVAVLGLSGAGVNVSEQVFCREVESL